MSPESIGDVRNSTNVSLALAKVVVAVGAVIVKDCHWFSFDVSIGAQLAPSHVPDDQLFHWVTQA